MCTSTQLLSHYTAVSTMEVQLCDQHGGELESLQDEHFSIVLCIQVDS